MVFAEIAVRWIPTEVAFEALPQLGLDLDDIAPG
jgi:hypothetical protein